MRPESRYYCGMTIELLLSLMGFAFVSSITPGPNNMMLLASGANFGLRRTLPHLFGISLGHSFMIIILGLGLIQMFDLIPWLQPAMTVAAVIYMLFLAWKIANATPSTPNAPESAGKPFTFLQAAGFQWVNPKGWFMAITALTAYTTSNSMWQVVAVAVTFMLTNLPSVFFWAALGVQARRFLDTPGRLRTFNWTMAVLLVLTLVPVVFGHE